MKKELKRDPTGKFSKKNDNPDCDPATKGYVKCLLRKTWYHNHEQHVDGAPSGIAVMFGVMGTLLAFLCTFYSPAIPAFESIGKAWLIPLFLFTIAMGVIFCELDAIASSYTETSDGQLVVIKKFEKKNECE